MDPGRNKGSILLADISGYSRFLNDVQVAHSADAFADGNVPPAYSMMAGFLEGIAAKVAPPFEVLKFEGDAVFAVAADDPDLLGQQLVECVVGCYADFAERRGAAREIWTCTCDACARQETLDLKFIAHHGEFFVQQVGPQVDAVGPEINVAHRLLKTDAADMVGSHGYGLFTDEVVGALGLTLDEAVRITETIDGDRVVAAHVIRLG